MKSAAKADLAEAVSAGRLTQAQADALTQRIDAAPCMPLMVGGGCRAGGPGGPGGPDGPGAPQGPAESAAPSVESQTSATT